jgi:hypothetical protein
MFDRENRPIREQGQEKPGSEAQIMVCPTVARLADRSRGARRFMPLRGEPQSAPAATAAAAASGWYSQIGSPSNRNSI